LSFFKSAMMDWRNFCLACLVLTLTACSQQSPSDAPHHGRYAGIGVYGAGPLWQKITGAAQSDVAKANTSDDDYIIVVVDSDTGAVRECGNLTGFCVGMNPWTTGLLATQKTPVGVSAHSADIARDAAGEVAAEAVKKAGP
jgi:hypothetical protein